MRYPVEVMLDLIRSGVSFDEMPVDAHHPLQRAKWFRNLGYDTIHI